MGWVATLAGTLIAAMFVYNWLNKDNSSSVTERTSHKSNAVTSPASPNGMLNRDSRKSTKPTPQVQTPTIIAIQNPEQTSSEMAKQKPAGIQTEAPSKKPTMMLPPPLPTVTSTSTVPGASPRSKSPPRLKPPTIGRPPAAPRPGGSTLRPPPSAASSLRVPTTKVLSNASMAPSSLMPPPPKKPSQQVILEPGHSPLDWAALTSNPNNNLRGKDAPKSLSRISPSQLKAQNGRKGKDAWTVYQGKVYNITPYVPFHPGGKGEILRGAGKDSAKLFMEVHPWVNWDGMLAECCVGILVAEEEAASQQIENKLDEMD